MSERQAEIVQRAAIAITTLPPEKQDGAVLFLEGMAAMVPPPPEDGDGK